MKCQIICSVCESETRIMFPNESPYPGEHVKFISGVALKDFICDICNKDIKKDFYACAFTIWADTGRQPYKEWESGFLKIE